MTADFSSPDAIAKTANELTANVRTAVKHGHSRQSTEIRNRGQKGVDGSSQLSVE